MTERVIISIFQVVGSPLCVASSDGQKVHDRIARILKEDRCVTLSFLNVTTLTSAFLNAAIGQLYGKFDSDEIRNRLKVTDMEAADIALLRRVVDTAKQYFRDPQRFERAVRAAIGDESDVS